MTDQSFPEAMREWGLEANRYRAERDELDRRIKDEQSAYDAALALARAKEMSPDLYKKWSSSSTPASARLAIEQAVLEDARFDWPVDINQLKVDMASAEKKYRDARTQYEFYASLVWREVTKKLPERVYAPPAGIAEQLPRVMPSVMASVPPPTRLGSDDKPPWEE